jgi:2-methylcitrate dehydratase PrpD
LDVDILPFQEQAIDGQTTGEDASMGVTEQVAQFIAQTTFAHIPPAAIDVAKGAIVDCFGVAMAGSQTDIGRIVARWAKEMGGAPAAGVIGGGFKTSLPIAARANGTMSHALDYDDVTKNTGHPTPPLLPAILALGETQRASGRELLEAYVVGFELESKLGNCMSRKHYAHGWHSTSIFGTLGAAAAAAKLLKLDVQRTQMALGIAASEAAGLRQNFGTMTKPYHAGLAAANGVIAATLAREGFTSAADSLEGEFGFLRVFGMPGEYDVHKLSDTLGNPWNLVQHGIGLKPYPCCRNAHRPLDAMLSLVQAHRFTAEEVEGIECEISAHVTKVMTYPFAHTGLEGKFSLPYCLAVAVCDQRVGIRQFADGRVSDPQVQELSKRTQILHPYDTTEWDTDELLPCVVRVRLKDGRVLEASAGAPRGDPDNPLTWAQIADKYRDCARELLSEGDVEQTLDLMHRLEELPNLAEVMEVVTFKGKSMTR